MTMPALGSPLARPAVLITSRFVCDSCSFHHDSSAKLVLAYRTLLYMFYCICCKCVHATSELPLRESRQRCSGNERCYGAYAHGVARPHCRVLYHIRRDKVRTKSNPRAKLPRNHHRTLQNAVVGNSAAKLPRTPPPPRQIWRAVS